jgi:CheY-like chemotaxis protein
VVDVTTKQILVVDDDAVIREVVAACLQHLGHWDVLTTASGKEALEQANTKKLDAIVLDVMMPEMDGFAVLQCLRSNPTTQSIPVLLLTASSHLPNSDRLPRLGVASIIFKPFDPVNLVQQIAQVLQ